MFSYPQLLDSIDSLIQEISTHRPLSHGELQALRQSLGVMYIRETNAIEGNSFTLGETRLLIEDGITIGGKTIREHQEILNHKELLQILSTAIREQTPLSEDLICQIHRQVLREIDDENAGVYRRIQVYISWDDRLPPPAVEVPRLMSRLMTDYSRQIADSREAHNRSSLLTQIVADFHYEFARIHPFIDGNGRTIRLLMNILLMQSGYPMIIIPTIRRSQYISTLSSYQTQEDFRYFFADIVHENLRDYLRMIG